MTDEGSAPTVPDTHRPTPLPGASPSTTPEERYALRTLLGRGGMGEVWLAHDARVGRDIAVKMMRGGTGDADAVARFLREARVQGRLEHPCVVPVHDLGGDTSAPYFAMKRLSGTTLADVLAAKDPVKWPRRTLLARFVDICLAVEFAHQRGVVHRDLKPANIMLGDFGEAYVLDWGLARMHGDSDTASAPPTVAEPGQTQAGTMLGTPGYMSPEQMRGDAIDQRTDIYALGCILFELLAGQPAIARNSAIEGTLSASHPRPSTKTVDVPPELDEACALATASGLGDRLASARDLADRVQKYLDGDRDLVRRRACAILHVDRARTHLERGDEGRALAMREAGSAIALDNENADAQALLARLLIEPPKTTPPAAQASIDAKRTAEAREMLRWISVNYLLFLVGLVFTWTVGVARGWPIIVIGAELVVLLVLTAIGLKRPSWIGRPLAISLTFVHCVLMASICVLLGPLLLGPALIFGSSTILLTGPLLRVPKLTVALHLLIIGVPLALELTGVLPRSFSLENGISLKPWAIHASGEGLLVTLLGGVTLQLVGNAFVLHKQRVTQDEAERQLHVQAWQLKQLVPQS